MKKHFFSTSQPHRFWPQTLLLGAILFAGMFLPTEAQRVSITFIDVVGMPGTGIGYTRAPSTHEMAFDDFKRSKNLFTFPELQDWPLKGRGAPGVALFDINGDGDLDIYVTNGPGKANSLFANQFVESGTVTFFDIARRTGLEATDQDSTGVCFGDTDNDGDIDIFVLGRAEPNRLYVQQMPEVFSDVAHESDIGSGNFTSASCSMGDINNDGLLDIAVGNTFDWTTTQAITSVPVALNQPNRLFLNLGNNRFSDVSASSGFLDIHLPPGAPPNSATITWAIAMIDYDLDGDIDILHADDQGAIRVAALGGLDRGFLQLFENNGSGQFTNVTEQLGLNRAGSWMGLSFADYDRNGTMDLFGTNFGNQFFAGITGNTERTIHTEDSRWFLQQPNGQFSDSFQQGFIHSPFGWGTSSVDYDNDGDTDIVFHGGHEAGIGVVVSPGVIFNNDGQGRFQRDAVALSTSTNHLRRTVHGMAAGDLNNDGFVDLVSVSNFDIPEDVPLFPVPPLGGEFDEDGFFVATFNPIDTQGSGFVWSGFEFDDGTLSVELNSADNGNNWIVIEPRGSIGLTTSGRVNRSAIGAVVQVTLQGLPTSLNPILGGASYASQDALSAYFGLGTSSKADVEILWPGGVRNRLLAVERGEQILFPEIPCSVDDQFDVNYLDCVNQALNELLNEGVIDEALKNRLFQSAIAGS